MRASDFRKQAWEALSGNWGIAILSGLVASLLGGLSMLASDSFSINIKTNSLNFDSFGQTLSTLSKKPLLLIILIIAFVVGATITLIIPVAFFSVGSIVEVGYSKFNLDLIDNNQLQFTVLFSYFKHWKVAILSNLLRNLYIFLWSLLFIIPGIIETFSYSMLPFILADNPDMSPKKALEYSKLLMDGNKWRLFCLMFSFIGWNILCVLTCGILIIWILPYKHAALAAFYRSINPVATIEKNADSEKASTNDNASVDDAASADNI